LLKVDRENRHFGRLDPPTLADAGISERADLKKCMSDSGGEFFAEIGEDVFVLGTEVLPSQTVPDRIDPLGIDAEGTTIIVELNRDSSKLQMVQTISDAGMLPRFERRSGSRSEQGGRVKFLRGPPQRERDRIGSVCNTGLPYSHRKRR